MSSLFVFDGMKRPSFTVKIDVESSTVADLFREVAKSYELELEPRKNLRIVFVDKELKFTGKKKLSDVGIINHSTIAVIFRLPDRLPTAAADVVESVAVKTEETSKDTTDIPVAAFQPEKTEQENTDAKEVSVAELEPVKTDEDFKDSNDISGAESKPLETDEENKDVNDVSGTESEVVKTDEEHKDTKDVSVTESEVVTIDKENKEADDISAAESEPMKAKHKIEKGKAVPVLEESKDAVNATVPTTPPPTTVNSIKGSIPSASGKVEEKRPVLQRLPGVVEPAYLPDFLDFDMMQLRAILPCFHVMGSETMRTYCQSLIDKGNTKITCPYPRFPFMPDFCPAVWDYKLVRHVACFTTEEMHDTEKTIAINFVGKDSSTLACPGCFTWCSKLDPKLTRLRCFLCTRATGNEFLFCGECLRQWENASSGSCANPECKSIEKTLDILRNSPVTNLYGGTWPTIRLCPRCGILTEFLGLCSQVHCQLCGYDYCFLCLKGAKSKDELKCIPYLSDCQRASLQTSIPQWDGHN